MADETPLAGGNASAGVVRSGETVRKPWIASTPAVIDYVTHVGAHGVDVPRPLGRDGRGRQIIEFVPGRLALGGEPLDHAGLARVGRLVRAIHDASADYAAPTGVKWDVLLPAPEADLVSADVLGANLICHNDLAPWNLMTGERWVFIDWDGAGPSTRLWDLAYAAQSFTLNDTSIRPDVAAGRLAAFVDGYGADAALRSALPTAVAERAAAMHDLLREAHETGREPWGTMYLHGHGEHWRTAADYAAAHVDVWRRAL
ncbi:phosphotransferase enzyme family protein [Leifsonia sp. NPDC058194]|uniref:phosphotransferase enzyme family protein n=1 Tax=Leifsonia sp. NPDC058194 TaxID=3346374 RepID=UPI0036DF4344